MAAWRAGFRALHGNSRHFACRDAAKKKALLLPPAARLPFSDNSSTFKCAVQTNYHSFFSVRDRKKKRTQKVGNDSEPSRGRLQPNRCAERDFLRKRKRSAISLWRRGSPEQGLEPVTHTACGTQKLFPSYFTRPTFDRCAKKKALPLPPAARLPFFR